jgi:hypothetical protein
LFSSASLSVPMRYPKGHTSPANVPNSTSLLCHWVCPKFNSHVGI